MTYISNTNLYRLLPGGKMPRGRLPGRCRVRGPQWPRRDYADGKAPPDTMLDLTIRADVEDKELRTKIHNSGSPSRAAQKAAAMRPGGDDPPHH